MFFILFISSSLTYADVLLKDPDNYELNYIWVDKKQDNYILRKVLRNCTFVIEENEVTLKKGISKEKIVPGGASKTVTRYSGKNGSGDINADGIEDFAVILLQESGGSGTFYYAAAVLSRKEGYSGTNAVFLGDRILIKNIDINGNKIQINYLGRKFDEPMNAKPEVDLSKSLQVISGKLVEYENKPTLTTKEWRWMRLVMNNGETVISSQPEEYIIIFSDNGILSGKTDCNSISAQVKIKGDKLIFGPFISTRKYCENSQEDLFMNSLNEVESYTISDDNLLILKLKSDGGSIIFK